MKDTLFDNISKKSLLNGNTKEEFRKYLKPATNQINEFYSKYKKEDLTKELANFRKELLIMVVETQSRLQVIIRS